MTRMQKTVIGEYTESGFANNETAVGGVVEIGKQEELYHLNILSIIIASRVNCTDKEVRDMTAIDNC